MARFLGVFSAAFLLLSSLSLASDKCDSYLVQDEQGNPVGVERIESILGRNVKVLDVSRAINERAAKSDPNLRIFDLSSVFTKNKMFLGFGKPNVYLALPTEENGEEGYSKFAAKSVKRGDSEIMDTHDVAQSGILVVFKNLDPETEKRIFESAKAHEGTRRWTCVNANCRVLADAGFTVGGESPEQYYFPLALLKDILRYGIQVDGKEVEFDVIRTNSDYLEDVRSSIQKSVWTTLCRHAERACEPYKNKVKSQSFFVKIKAGTARMFGAFFKADTEEPLLESKMVQLPEPPTDSPKFDMGVSEPSRFGTLVRLIWGPHSLFEIPFPREAINRLLPNVLKAFPQEKPDFITKLKKNFLFSPPVVGFLRSQLAKRYSFFPHMNEKNLFDMMRTDSPEYPNRYNLVLTGNKAIIMKISIKMKLVDWVLSKHVLMSGYSKDVRFAGEVWKSEDGKLHINTNSGTYQPKNEDLGAIEELFGMVFPNIPLETHPM